MEFGESKGQRSKNSSSSTSGTIFRSDVWELHNNQHNDSSSMDWATNPPPIYAAGVAAAGQFLHPTHPGEGSSHAPPPLDPHLVCLNLGKRHYFEDHYAGEPIGTERRAAGLYEEVIGGGGRKVTFGRGSAAVPRCQVEGCHVALVNVKDYHRRHKVCEVHSKAPKVVVLGLEQRFCQQCSRFHVVSEFEETKRSCKRRLAGHNERRRKNSSNPNHENKAVMMSGGGFPYTVTVQQQQGPCAYTLLSSNTNADINAWVPPSDLSSRSSAALRELIAENRARQLDTWHHHHSHLAPPEAAARDDLCSATAAATGSAENYNSHHPNYPVFIDFSQGHGQESSAGHVTLDLMEGPTPEFVYVSGGGCGGRTKAPKAEEDHFDFWNYS